MGWGGLEEFENGEREREREQFKRGPFLVLSPKRSFWITLSNELFKS